jgi:hypothetical protein
MSKFSTPFLKKSPILGAYTSGAGGMAYASNRQAFQKLQDDIVKGAKEADEIFTDPENQAKRLENRIDRRKKRASKKGPTNQELAKGKKALDFINPGFEDKPLVNKKRTKFDKKTAELETRKQKATELAEKNKNKIFAENDEERAMIYALRSKKN